MKVTLDHTQRLNLHALLGAQRADVGSIRAIWAIQDRLALDAWRTWGHDYAQHGRCQNCNRLRTDDGRFLIVRRTSRSRWLCLDCWDGGAR